MRLFLFIVILKINRSNIKSKNTLGAQERLKSRTIIQQLFKEGKALSVFPIRVVYLEVPLMEPFLQAGFTVGTRQFKRAVQRNRIKRLMREVYRMNNHTLKCMLEERSIHLAVFFMFTGKELPDYGLVFDKMKLALKKMENQLMKT